MAGNFLRPLAHRPVSLPRRTVDLNWVAPDFYRGHDCRKSARSGHHLRLFWTRQPALEFPGAYGCRSCDFWRAARALFCNAIGTARFPLIIGDVQKRQGAAALQNVAVISTLSWSLASWSAAVLRRFHKWRCPLRADSRRPANK